MLSTTYDLTTGSSSRNILSAIGFYMSQVSKFTFNQHIYFKGNQKTTKLTNLLKNRYYINFDCIIFDKQINF